MIIIKNLNIFRFKNLFMGFILIFYLNSFAQSKTIPDFSDLAEELLPSVVSISVMLSNEPTAPGTPQFPPGSPFEDFFKDFFVILCCS